MFTRSELEDIWNNQPYGYFQKMMHQQKGKKKYKLTCLAYRQTLIAQEDAVVYAKNKTAAEAMTYGLSQQLRAKHGIEVGAYDIVYRYRAECV